MFVLRPLLFAADATNAPAYAAWPRWLKAARTNDAQVAIVDGAVVWKGGNEEGGTWKRGLWLNGTWEAGTCENGTWFGGDGEGGTWAGGMVWTGSGTEYVSGPPPAAK